MAGAHKEDIVIGGIYRFKHSSGPIDVKVLRVYTIGGGYERRRMATRYLLLNLKTNHEIVAKSSRKFLFKIN